MKKFRFSSKSQDKTDSGRFTHISIPQKDPLAIIPPKKVIKALYDYQVQDPAQNPGYLSFAQGDFLHVVGREDDTDWYDACNPLHNTRGLVPVNYFSPVDKTTRNSNTDSFLNSLPNGTPPAAPQMTQTSMDMSDGSSSRKSAGRSGNMVYGIVMHDFKAERPDELDATAGEAIIVIAQSNPEWFVAKPITRLGGPGLIPVSFIEVKDMATGRTVEDVQEAVRKAGVPPVEEWKRMAAEYKNSSVSLGKLNFGNNPAMAPQQGMERLSINSRRSAESPRYGPDVRSQERSSGAYAQSQYYQQMTRSMQLMNPMRARIAGYLQREGEFIFNVQALMEDGRAWNLQRTYNDFYGLQFHLIEQFPEAAGKTQGVERTLPMMPGPLPWVTEKLTNDRCVHLNVYLFKLLQITMMTQSHVVRGFFYPKDHDTEIQPPEDLLYNYRMPDVHAPAQDFRLSDASQHSAPQFTDSRGSSSQNLSSQNHTSPQRNQQYQQQQQQYPQHQQPSQQQQQPYRSTSPQSQANQANHYRTPSELRALNGNGMPPPPSLRNNSTSSAGSGAFPGAPPPQQPPQQQQHPASNGVAQSTATKIKVWFGESNCVVIRLPAVFTYGDLVNKLRERWSLEPGIDKETAQEAGFNIEYRDEQTNAYYRIISDMELGVARDRNDKLTLRVLPISGMM